MAHDIKKLETQILQLDKSLKANTFSDNEIKVILKHIYQPGFTTEPEIKLLYALVDALNKFARNSNELRITLIDAVSDISNS